MMTTTNDLSCSIIIFSRKYIKKITCLDAQALLNGKLDGKLDDVYRGISSAIDSPNYNIFRSKYLKQYIYVK